MDLKTLLTFVKQSGGWMAAIKQANRFSDAAPKNSYNGQESSNLLMIGTMFMLIAAIAFLIFVAVPSKFSMKPIKNEEEQENETTEV